MAEKKTEEKTGENAVKNIDWKKIKTEYIKSDISARNLAARHDIAYSTLRRHMETEKWSAARTQFKRSAEKQSIAAMARSAARKAERFKSMTDKMAIKLDKAIETCDGEAKTIASLMSSLRQLQIIQGFDRSKLDDEEQIARIAALKARSEAQAPPPQTLEISGMPEGWCK